MATRGLTFSKTESQNSGGWAREVRENAHATAPFWHQTTPTHSTATLHLLFKPVLTACARGWFQSYICKSLHRSLLSSHLILMQMVGNDAENSETVKL